MLLEPLIKLCVTEPNFLEKLFYPKNWGNGPEIGCFEFKEKIHEFSLNFFHNENLCYLLYSSTNLMFWKNLVPER